MKLTDFNNLTNFGIEDPRMTTIGGVAFRHLDRLPMVGDSISIEDIVITILEMDDNRIHRVRVNRGGKVEENSEDETSQEPGVTETTAAGDSKDAAAGSGDQSADGGTDTLQDFRGDTQASGDDRQDPQRKANA